MREEMEGGSRVPSRIRDSALADPHRRADDTGRTASAQCPPSALLGRNRIVTEIKPIGKRFSPTVPDILDQAERARLAVHALTAFLNEKANYAPYGHTYCTGNPPYMADLPGGTPNCTSPTPTNFAAP